MRRFPEPQHYFAAGWQNWDFRPSRKGPRWILLIIILVYIKNLALVAPGFEGSKSQKIILKGLRTLRTWGLAKNTSSLGGSRTLQEGPIKNLSKYSEGMVHLLLLLPKQLWTDPQRKGAIMIFYLFSYILRTLQTGGSSQQISNSQIL